MVNYYSCHKQRESVAKQSHLGGELRKILLIVIFSFIFRFVFTRNRLLAENHFFDYFCELVKLAFFIIMIDYIKGEISELTPTFIVLESNGVGYGIHIALTTFSALADVKLTKLFVHEIIREDAHLLFGFQTKTERELFLLLISVSGIGANTARMIMSSYSVAEIRQIISLENVAALNSIKGIGAKTAQRIIVELKDKILRIEVVDTNGIAVNANVAVADNNAKNEAISALTMLGFAAVPSGKVVDALLKKQADLTVEQLIKQALKML